MIVPRGRYLASVEKRLAQGPVPAAHLIYATARQRGRYRRNSAGKNTMRSGCLWLLGVPIPIIILLWLITGHA